MMGETGPCGPCSELHLDLTINGDSQGKLVNCDFLICIEIWNLVFIQFNADRDGNFTPLKEKHVDTGMGFERVAAVMQSTRNFTDFSKPASNYDTDVFSPLFTKLEELSEKLTSPPCHWTENQKTTGRNRCCIPGDCGSFEGSFLLNCRWYTSGNSDRNYVLRRILRRAVKYGRTLGFSDPFFYKLAPILVEQMGDIFPELKERSALIEKNSQIGRGIL